MDFVTAFREKSLVQNIVQEIHKISKKKVALMEVCGGHTMAIQKNGIANLLPDHIKLKSGPGCPVCVTSKKFIDQAIALCENPKIIIATYGDLIRTPGSNHDLSYAKARGGDIRIVYSVLDALQLAKNNPQKKVIFLGIGFETTTPASAAAILRAKSDKLTNFLILSAHKVMPPAMRTLLEEKVLLDGFICPGHVSAIAGSSMYQPLASQFGVACVVSGFEPVDILQSIKMLIHQIENDTAKVEIAYRRAVKPKGNLKALKLMYEVFEPADDWWRGLGIISDSGLKIQDKYASFDAAENFEIPIMHAKEPPGCICGQVLKGTHSPQDCKLFAKVCKPENPIGACMVSHEGACQAHYRYNR